MSENLALISKLEIEVIREMTNSQLFQCIQLIQDGLDSLSEMLENEKESTDFERIKMLKFYQENINFNKALFVTVFKEREDLLKMDNQVIKSFLFN